MWPRWHTPNGMPRIGRLLYYPAPWPMAWVGGEGWKAKRLFWRFHWAPPPTGREEEGA